MPICSNCMNFVTRTYYKLEHITIDSSVATKQIIKYGQTQMYRCKKENLNKTFYFKAPKGSFDAWIAQRIMKEQCVDYDPIDTEKNIICSK